MKKNMQFVVLSMIFLLFVTSVHGAKLPTVGSEDERDQYGNILNDYLLVAHTENGTLKNNSVKDLMLDLTSITLADFTNDAGFLTVVGNPNIATGTITAGKLNLTDITLNDFTNDAGYQKIADFAGAFNTNLSAKSTSDLVEGTNLYFTNTRADARFNSLFVNAFNSNLSASTLAVINGGTGATTASGARTNLGLVIGTDVQAFDADLTTYAGITPSANIQTLLGSANFAAARTNLGLAIGTDVQAFDAQLSDVAGLAVTDNNFIVGDGVNFVAESGATARTSLGLGSLSTLSTITTSEITDGTIVNADVSGTAAITYGKLTFSNNIVAGDIATGAVETTEILDNTIAKVDVSTGFIRVGNLADDSSGWVPDGAATSFTITANAADVGANSVITVSLGANADAGAVCGVTTRTASTNFVVGCASSPDNGATLQYAIIN